MSDASSHLWRLRAADGKEDGSMGRWLLGCMMMVMAVLSGCERGEDSRAGGSSGGSDEGFEIQWPGGSVKIGRDTGVDVRAPGVDVRVNDETGVKVKAPGVDVNANSKDGVGVKAPGVDVRVERGKSAGGSEPDPE